MHLNKYKDFDEYKNYQINGNKGNSDGQWCQENEIQFLSKYLLENVSPLNFGICHGTKQGSEQKWFSQYTNAKVIGTEISDSAKSYPNTIEWDFHKVKDEWLDNIDFIYSNALDHSYDPIMCLNSWMSCVKITGLCILEWTISHGEDNTSMVDPFGASEKEYEEMILNQHFLIKDKLIYQLSQIEKKYFIIKK